MIKTKFSWTSRYFSKKKELLGITSEHKDSKSNATQLSKYAYIQCTYLSFSWERTLTYKNLYFLISCMISDSDSSHHFSNLELFKKDDTEYVFQDMNFSSLKSLLSMY